MLPIIWVILFGLCAAKDSVSWMVVSPEHFLEVEHCKTLGCEKNQLCIFDGVEAKCVGEKELDQIEGTKSYYKTVKEMADEELQEAINFLNAKDFDPEAVKEKFLEYQNLMEKKMEQLEREKNKNEVHKHHTPRKSDRKDCDIGELKSIGGRLLQWFGDVHASVKTNEMSPLPAHKFPCKPEVGWMFEQWDGDHDGELTVEELNSLEKDEFESCIKPFMDRCDEDQDDAISIDEWCSCFNWISNDGDDEPPCRKARMEHDPMAEDPFIPRCDVDGFFRPVQCHGSSCWCADKWGREFDKSRREGRKPDCGQYADEDAEYLPFGKEEEEE